MLHIHSVAEEIFFAAITPTIFTQKKPGITKRKISGALSIKSKTVIYFSSLCLESL